MRKWMIIRLAVAGLCRTPLRVALTSLGVAIAAGALVSMVGFALGVQKQAEIPFQTLDLLNNIQVTLKEDDDSEDGPVLDDEALRRMERIPGVSLCYPVFLATGIEITYKDESQTAMAVGLPREAMLLGSMQDTLVAGDFFTVGDAPEVLITKRISDGLGFDSPKEAVGKTVTLEAMGLAPEESETFRFERREFQLTVVGVYSMPGMSPGMLGRGAVLPMELIRHIPGIEAAPVLENLRAGRSGKNAGYERVTVRVTHPKEIESVEEEIGKMGFKTRTFMSRFDEMRNFFLFLDVLLASVGTVALIVAALGIVNTLLMSVLERYQEIGVYKTIGASDGDLLVLFLTEAGVIGLLGGLGGLLIGSVVSWGLEIAANMYAQSQGATAELELFAFPLWLLLGAIGFSIAVSVFAGVYPALRAARVDPIKALRSE